MRAFHGDPAIKVKYLARVRTHITADDLIRGTGWDGSKGCAVGCTLEKYDHKAYEKELGIPEWLARIEDTLFEGMTEEKSRIWPEVFLKAIPIGADLRPVKAKFFVILLKSTLKSMNEAKFDVKKFPGVAAAIQQSKAAVEQMIAAHEAGGDLSAAESAARSAAESAWSAARSARSAAESARSAESAAAWSARSAAESARSAESAAAWSAAESARSAWSAAARSAAYDYYADELIKLLKGAEK